LLHAQVPGLHPLADGFGVTRRRVFQALDHCLNLFGLYRTRLLLQPISLKSGDGAGKGFGGQKSLIAFRRSRHIRVLKIF
jgi:hypothetical protein